MKEKILAKLSDTAFNPIYLLFCSKNDGRGHIARHLGVSAHLDGMFF